jgi:hypothetical protein
MVKRLLLFSIFLLAVVRPTFAQVILGPAVMFDYDGVGNRIKRYYNPNTPLNVYKTGTDSASTYPLDTIKEEFTIGDLSNSIIVKAYPNPVMTELTFENKTWDHPHRVEVRLNDMTGKLITVKKSNQAKDVIPFGDVSPGMYTVEYFLDGRYITTWKVFKN